MPLEVLFLIFLALTFDFLNGFHDSANSIATVVSTRVLSPRYAVIWAAFFNFIAFLFFGLHVANTIGKGLLILPFSIRRLSLAPSLVPAVGTLSPGISVCRQARPMRLSGE